MAIPERETKRERLYLRVTSRQRDVIAEAAEAVEKDLSAFVLEAALMDAQRTLADRMVFRLDDAKWGAFVEMLERPVDPHAKPRLEKLLRDPSVLDT